MHAGTLSLIQNRFMVPGFSAAIRVWDLGSEVLDESLLYGTVQDGSMISELLHPRLCLTESVYEVVLRQSNPARIHQLVLHYY